MDYVEVDSVDIKTQICDENSNNSDFQDIFNPVSSADIEFHEVLIKSEYDEMQSYEKSDHKNQIIEISSINRNQQSMKSISEESSTSPDRKYCLVSSMSKTTAANFLNDSGVASNDSEKEESIKKLCLVCGDAASGFHYGVASCEACKAFFKRSVQGNIEYTCPGQNDCEINKRRRKACQSCRFQKCLSSGMLKEGVRLDRVRGGRQKYRRSVENPNLVHVMKSSKSVMMLENIQILQSLLSCEPDSLEANLNEDDDENNFLLMLSDLYDRELVNIITWAKLIPGFGEITLKDQMRILQSSWSEILTISLVYRSLSQMSPFVHREKRFYFASNLSINQEEAKSSDMYPFFDSCCVLMERFEKLRTTKEEFFLIKALLLANSDVNVEDVIPVKNFRETILISLNETLEVLRPNSTNQHIQELLLCLPVIKMASVHLKSFWIKVMKKNLVPMNRLFVEMLKC